MQGDKIAKVLSHETFIVYGMCTEVYYVWLYCLLQVVYSICNKLLIYLVLVGSHLSEYHPLAAGKRDFGVHALHASLRLLL